ncbi:hypothetical protein M5K25_010632 [Dendrobium thyrsiflorum]|uniref:Uncharacterized protein n=1 Tax=Dendrobium thyrsiflorum TaxID=117978 RepID=A0ABD0V0V5_DENTH
MSIQCHCYQKSEDKQNPATSEAKETTGGHRRGGNPSPFRGRENSEVEIIEGDDGMPPLEPLSREEISMGYERRGVDFEEVRRGACNETGNQKSLFRRSQRTGKPPIRALLQRIGMGNRCGAYDEKGIFISIRLRGNDCASFRQAFEAINKENSSIKMQSLRQARSSWFTRPSRLSAKKIHQSKLKAYDETRSSVGKVFSLNFPTVLWKKLQFTADFCSVFHYFGNGVIKEKQTRPKLREAESVQMQSSFSSFVTGIERETEKFCSSEISGHSEEREKEGEVWKKNELREIWEKEEEVTMDREEQRRKLEQGFGLLWGVRMREGREGELVRTGEGLPLLAACEPKETERRREGCRALRKPESQRENRLLSGFDEQRRAKGRGRWALGVGCLANREERRRRGGLRPLLVKGGRWRRARFT